METMTLEAAINEIAQALAQLEIAKEDCNDMVDATFDAYFGEIPDGTSKKEIRMIKAGRKTETKNIKKLAKAILKGAKQEAKEEADNMTELCDRLG